MSERIYAFGLNNYGQLGLGHTDYVINFTKVEGGWEKIVAMKCVGTHTILRSEDGKIYAAGRNNIGQLGLGHTNAVCVFEEVASGLGKISEMSCEANKTVLRSVDGKVYAAGGNYWGQLGLGHKKIISTLTEVTGVWNIAEISCGGNHTFLRSVSGKVYAAGCNDDGQLGIGKTDRAIRFTEVAGGWGKIAEISCGINHTFLRSVSDKLYSAGRNHRGQLGLAHIGTNNVYTFKELWGDRRKIAKISCGWNHTFLQYADNKLYATGDNSYGQLGIGGIFDESADYFQEAKGCWGEIAEISISVSYTILRSVCGKIYATGNGLCSNNNILNHTFKELFPQVLDRIVRIAKISCDNHTFMIEGSICQKCKKVFTPKRLSDEMLMATKIPGICADMIYKIIKLYARMSEKSDCSKGGHCHC